MDQTLKKNYLLILLLLAVVLAFIALRVAVPDRPSTGTPDVLDPEAHKLDRLFHGLGILKVPRISLPADISVTDLTGKRVRFSDMKGKIVFLNFWATWCMACLVEFPAMNELNDRLKGRDFVMLAVSMQEPAAEVKDYAAKHKLNFTVLLDPEGEAATRFGVISVPTTFVMDKEGSIVGRAIGAREWNSQEAVAVLEYLIETGVDHTIVDEGI